MQNRSVSDVRPLSRRIVDTFAAPRRMASEMRVHAPWQGPLLITTAVAVIGAASLPEEFFLSRAEKPVDRLGRPVAITSSPEEVVRWGRYRQMFSAAVEHPVVVLLVAALITVIFSVAGRGHASMRQYFALAAHAFLISAVGVLLTAAWHLATGNAEAQPSLALLLGSSGDTAQPAATRFLGLVNPFTLWMLLVLAVGVDELDRRWSFPAAAGVLIGLYLALAAVLAAAG